MSARLSPLTPTLAMATGSLIPVRCPLFDKRVDALMRMRIEQAARHGPAYLTISGLEAEVDLAVKRLVALADEACAAGADQPGEMSDRGVEFGQRNDAVHQSPGECGRGVDGLARQQQFHDPLARYIARNANRGRRAEHADVHAG